MEIMGIKAMKQALEALEALEQLQGGCTDSDDGTVEAITVWCPEVIDALRQAIEQAEQAQPVAWINKSRNLLSWDKFYADMTPLYTAPVDGVTISEERVDEIVKQEHDKQIEIAQAYERGWNAALAQQEPVAWMGAHDKTDLYYRKPPQADVIPLYTTPPQRKPLTDEEIETIANDFEEGYVFLYRSFARAIEAKLKEKNT